VTRGGPAPAVGPVDTRAFENSPVTGTAGSTDRGAMSPGHRAAPRTRPAASTPGVAPAPGDQCVIVAGHTIC
jgi:hypothetical protein